MIQECSKMRLGILMELLIVRAFNPIFFILIGVIGLFTLLFAHKVRNNPKKKAYIIAYYIFLFIFYWVYKYFISIDVEYMKICGQDFFTWWNEIPLNLCNIILLFLPVAIYLENTPLLAFCFFCSFVGPLFATIMPGVGFDGYSLLLPRIFGYFFTHISLMFSGVVLVMTGLYKPRWKDLKSVLLIYIVTSIIVFGICEVMIHTGANPYANFLFCMDPDGNAILEFFYSLIPLPYVYTLPLILIALPLFALIATPFEIVYKKRES